MISWFRSRWRVGSVVGACVALAICIFYAFCEHQLYVPVAPSLWLLLIALALAGTEVAVYIYARPLHRITVAVQSLAANRVPARLRSRRLDEPGRLARAVDALAVQLDRRWASGDADAARLRIMLNSMVEAVFVTDRDGRIVLVNAALETLLATGALGRSAVEAIRHPVLYEAVRGALRGQPGTVEVEARVGGDLRTLAAQIAPLAESAGVVAVLRDITELKRADETRRDFVANASHELRTPLTAIRGYAETLRDGGLAEPEVAGKFLDKLLDNTHRLEQLVEDLLILSRAESPESPLELASVSVKAAFERAFARVELRAQEKNLRVATELADDALLVRADAQALDQVLVNLLDNAVKYSTAGGQIAIKAASTGEHVVIDVVDSGPGIAESHLPRIFERFYRVDFGRARWVGGTGLGLAIARRFVERMGGEITVASQMGVGTTFHVRLGRGDDLDPQP